MNPLINNTCPDVPTGTGAVNLFLSLVNAIFTAKCSLDQSAEYPENSGPLIEDGDTFDFIIIGSGAGGSVVGNELSKESKWRVLVLEAGGLPSTDSEVPGLFLNLANSSEDWQFKMKPNKNALLGLNNQRVIWHRGKLLGGSTSINFMFYIRGQDVDFDGWASMGNTGWDYKSIFPYYLMNENITTEGIKSFYGSEGPQKLIWDHRPNDPLVQAVYKGVKELNLKVLKAEGTGFFEAPTTMYDGFRQNAAKAFLGSAKNRKNLLLSYNSYAEKIIIENKRATGVLVNIQGRRLILKATKEVIVSGGAINSPQLLLLSGIGPKDELKKLGIKPIANLPVGRNLHDHLWYVALFFKAASLSNDSSSSIDDIYNYIMYKNNTTYGKGSIKLSGFTHSLNSDVRENQLYFLLDPINGISDFFPYFPLKSEYAKLLLDNNQKYPLLQIVLFMVNPISRGRVSLNSSDPYEKPVIALEFLQYEEEVERTLRGIKFVLDLVHTEPMRDLGLQLIDLPVKECDKFKKYSDDYWRCSIRYFTTIGYHPVGSCKMGVDSTAVVDPRLKVHGIDKLRVIDASIMPQVTKGNTMAPTLLIGRKGGSMIREDWK